MKLPSTMVPIVALGEPVISTPAWLLPEMMFPWPSPPTTFMGPALFNSTPSAPLAIGVPPGDSPIQFCANVLAVAPGPKTWMPSSVVARDDVARDRVPRDRARGRIRGHATDGDRRAAQEEDAVGGVAQRGSSRSGRCRSGCLRSRCPGVVDEEDSVERIARDDVVGVPATAAADRVDVGVAEDDPGDGVGDPP